MEPGPPPPPSQLLSKTGVSPFIMRQTVHGTELQRKGRGWHRGCGGGGKSSSPCGGASGPRELSGFPTGSASPLPPFQPCFGSSPASFALPPRRTFARFPLAQPSASTEAARSSEGRNKWAGRAASAQLVLARAKRPAQAAPRLLRSSSAPSRPLFLAALRLRSFLPFPPQKKKLYDIAKLQERPPGSYAPA